MTDPRATGLSEATVARWCCRLAVVVGVAVRLAVYLKNRSLWLDEASLALNIVRRSFTGLLKPLDHNQGAPVAFLLLEKLSITLFDNQEYALRLVPVIAGVLAVPLFYGVARRCLPAVAAAVAVLLFAISPVTVYYASELKQYSLDQFLTLLVIWQALRLRDSATPLRWAALALTGVLLPWCSHPSAFVMAGTLLTLFLGRRAVATTNEPRRHAGLIAVAACWGVSFLAAYVVSLRDLAAQRFLLAFWSRAFAPIPLTPKGVSWYVTAFVQLFHNPGGTNVMQVAAAMYCIGLVWLWRRDRQLTQFLTLPILVALAASALHKYPFNGRMLLFLAPLLVLPIAAGFEALWRFRGRDGQVAALAALVVLLASEGHGAAWVLSRTPATTRPEDCFSPPTEDVRGAVRYIAAHYQPGDAIFVYNDSAYDYYADRFGLGEVPAALCRPAGDEFASHDWPDKLAALSVARGVPRAWILLYNTYSAMGDDERPVYEVLIPQVARPLEHFTSDGVDAYLCDGRHPASSPAGGSMEHGEARAVE